MSRKKNKGKKQKLPFDIGSELIKALQYHQSGQLQKAEEIYKKILEIDPYHSDSLHLSGIIAHQVGKNDIAVNLINKAIQQNPKSPIYYNNLGIALKDQDRLSEAISSYQKALDLEPAYADAYNNMGNAFKDQGKLDEAISSYQKALQLRPDDAEVYNNLGNAFKDQSRLDEAISSYQKALELKPDLAKVYNNLGAAFKDQGKLSEAISSYEKALELKPDFAEAYNNLGNAFNKQGKLDEAISSYQKALQLRPDDAEVYNNLGNAFKDQGNLSEAISSYEKVLQLKPDYAEAYNNLGAAFKDQGKLSEAISSYEKALELKPDFAEAYNNLGAAFKDQGRLSEAISSYEKALELKPDFAEAYNNLGAAFKDQGRLSEAISNYQRALELKPDFAVAHSNLLFSLHYHDSIDPVRLFSQHQQWAAQHASPLATTIEPHLNDRSAERCLRVGYVSPDFSMHSVAYFIEAVLASHDRSAFEIFCYSDVACPDPVTDRLKGLASCWRDIIGMSDEQVADLIRSDQIDILVDLAGHTAYNRMLLFVRKPAPVQVTYLGYPNTTGLPTMDYRITDAWSDPPGEIDNLYSEELVRLPHGFLCYQPPKDGPDVAKLPALSTGQITFGSFNNLCKITREVVALWSTILSAVPNARLIMKSKALADRETRQRMQEMFVQNGVSAAQVKLIGFIPSFAEHLALYNSVDIGLDTFPYNGTTTTCEALWMGVPVIVLAGDYHASRVGLSLLSNIGLTDLITETSEAYVDTAVRLAGDLNWLQHLRTDLRHIITRSNLTDAQRFTCSLEEAYRQMWLCWCENSNSSTLGSSAQTRYTLLRGGERKSPAKRKLHIGGTVFHPEWEVINAVPASYVDHLGDAKDLSRFGDETFSEIYASHVLEHFDYVSELDAVLKEWARVLQPGGKLYISVPDMDKLTNLFLMKDKLSLQERFHVMRMMFGGQTSAYDYHKVGFNLEILEYFLTKADFTNIGAVDDFGIFKDTSTMEFHGVPISINVVAERAAVLPGQRRRIHTAAKTIDIFDDDIFLVSYPRSGNTWLRFVLASIIHNVPNIDFELVEKYAPDLYMHDNGYLLTAKRPRIIKSHEKYNSAYPNVVYLCRDVRDVIISMYFYLKKQGDNLGFDEYFNLFIAGKLFQHLNFGNWSENVRSWLENKANILFVKYEDMLTDSKGTICKILDYLHIDCDEQLAKDVITKYDFENMSRIEQNTVGVNYLDKNKEIPFIRRGTRGQWKSFLDDRHVNIVKEKYGTLLTELGYESGYNW